MPEQTANCETLPRAEYFETDLLDRKASGYFKSSIVFELNTTFPSPVISKQLSRRWFYSQLMQNV